MQEDQKGRQSRKRQADLTMVNTSKGSSQPETDASLALEKLQSPRRDGKRKLAGHRSGGEYLEGQRSAGDGRKLGTGEAVKPTEGRQAQAGRPSKGGTP